MSDGRRQGSAPADGSLRSMTGYGQASTGLDDVRLTVEIRAVNHRYADLRLRMPADLADHEAAIKRRILARVQRGRVEVNVAITTREGAEARPVFNAALAEEALEAARLLRDRHGLAGEPDVAAVLSLPGAFRVESPSVDWGDDERAALEAAVDRAVEALDEARLREGEHLSRDLADRLRAMGALTAAAAERARSLPETVAERLRERIGALAGDVEIDQARVAQEAAHLADRSDVTEETVRLASHLEQALAICERPGAGPHGKRLDFLVQEMQRETNTIASKSSDLTLTRLALDLKSETEKVREQVQNIE